MKKLLEIIVLSLLFSGNANAENITIRCVDEKRDLQLILNFDEEGNWIKFNGQTKEVAGRKDNGIGEELISIKITKDKITYFNSMKSMDTHMVVLVNRFDGRMDQYGKLKGEKYHYNYMCEKTERKF